MTREKSGLVAVPHAVPVEHDVLSVDCAGPSLIREPSHTQDVSSYVKYLDCKDDFYGTNTRFGCLICVFMSLRC